MSRNKSSHILKSLSFYVEQVALTGRHTAESARVCSEEGQFHGLAWTRNSILRKFSAASVSQKTTKKPGQKRVNRKKLRAQAPGELRELEVIAVKARLVGKLSRSKIPTCSWTPEFENGALR